MLRSQFVSDEAFLRAAFEKVMRSPHFYHEETTFGDLNIDSLDSLQIVGEIERGYGIKFSDDELAYLAASTPLGILKLAEQRAKTL